MLRLDTILHQLKIQRVEAQAEVGRLGRAIDALTESRQRGPGRLPALPRPLKPGHRVAPRKPSKARRHMSAAGRQRIAAAQRARWAKVRGNGPKRNISPEGRRRISESARRRWAAARKAHGDSVTPMRLLSNAEVAALQEQAKAAKAVKAP